jgi:alginate O-acetyltransferase complex protein AlgI
MPQVNPARLLQAILFRPGDHFGLTSGLFGCLLLLFLCVYALAGTTREWRVRLLLIFSLYFTYKASGFFVVVLLLSSLMDFRLGIELAGRHSRNARRILLWAGVIGNLAVLVAFRYSHAWAGWVARAESSWLPAGLSGVPVGLSFYTFQKISYLADVYRRQTPAATGWREFLLYVCFFPRLLAGPIVRAGEFMPQLDAHGGVARAEVGEAVALISSGLFKKAVIADYIGINFVDRVFAAPTLYSGAEGLLAVYGYAIQIYCDFSGYTDMALGFARLVGIRLPANFASPYQAIGVTDFWRRWHITLSQWLRDYLFLPVAYLLSRSLEADRFLGVKTDIWIYLAAALVTWLACGLWHGAAWGFVVWGLLHGGAVAIEKITRWPQKMGRTRVRRVLSRVVTFHIVSVAWVFFRADSLSSAGQVLRQIAFSFEGWLLPQVVSGYPMVFALILTGFLLHYLPDRSKSRLRGAVEAMPLAAQSFTLAAMVWLAMQARAADIQPFIYFRF